MMLSVRLASRAFSTTFFMSEGARNWPFLMFTGFPAAATAWMKSVCRQRKAGVWSTSTTSATSAISSSACTSVSTGTPIARRTLSRISSPFSIPSPRNDFPELRFALSYDDLKMNGIASSRVISLSFPATSIWSCSLSTTQGPAMRKKGRSRPASNPQSFMGSRGRAADHLQPRLLDALLVLLQRRLDERDEERMSRPRRRGEFGVVLAAEEPRMVGELRHLGEVLGLRLRTDREPRRLEPRHVMVVHLIPVAVTLGDRFLAVDPPGERAPLHRAGLRAQAHGAAQVRLRVAPFHPPVVALPLGDERDHRMRRVGIELRGVGAF